MKKLLIPIFILIVVLLGYYVYQDAERKKKNEVNQLIYDAHQSLNVIDSNPNLIIQNAEIEDVTTEPLARFIVQSKK
ncbi:hypothetical protein B9T25_10340 [Acinetobacter sp. ANC 4470]|uniref:hypothetical protein n=1 Tax=Acinetobacter sp. ANC 4470 TaxID=1977881 RepID=UPI000A34C579|nr:hypothetical protein [Acinetobacter sp. ANC 4470]OTG66198.1 hypothetical protein B9T25_10340 [Acinetobacter sp. ANC 4470]